MTDERNMTIMMRDHHIVNTDPQRRCYYGVNAREALVVGSWKVLEYTTKEYAQERLKFWRRLNKIATDARGKGAHTDFKVVPR